tara:strand:- start:116 stop:424 length:309 start_codon:yes stop_codon:yes gene_type:complete
MDFNPALPLPIKFSISPNKFDPDEKQLSLFIPTESVTHFLDHIKNLVNTKTAQGEVYDFNQKKKVKTQGIYINAKALEGDFGSFGNINPQKIENAPNSQGLF